jgi:glycerophosphoryl diester phosphodiesterase
MRLRLLSPPDAPTTTIAHRGASAHAPENTLAAVRTAIDLGCDLVEVDVHRTRDGHLVVMHDVGLTRTTDATQALPGHAPWRVGDLTYGELLRLDAGSWFSPAHVGERVPTLAQVIDLLADSDTGLLLEVKEPGRYPGIARDLAAELRERTGYVESAAAAGRLVVQSFNHDVMRTFAGLEPRIPIGLLGHPPQRRLPALAEWASFVNPRHRRATTAYVDAIHAEGMQCLVWTPDSVADIHRGLSLGVDGVITNRPDVLQRMLEDRLVTA